MLIHKLSYFRAVWPALAATALLATTLTACEDDSEKQASPEATSSSGIETEVPNNVPTRTPNNPPNNNNPPVQPLPPAVPVEGPETQTCGNTTCRDRLVGDIVVEPCCVNGDGCGLDLDAVSGFMPVTNGCVELDQPGSNDTSCPSVYFDDIVNPRELVGCCRPDGVCGVVADLSDTLANFGCVDPNEFLSGRGEQSPPRDDDEFDDDGQPGLHLTDGGGFYVTDGGPSTPNPGSGQCVPQLPVPEPTDAAVDAAAVDAVIGDAASSETPSPIDAASPSIGPDADSPDVGIVAPVDSTAPSVSDAAASDAG